MKRIVVTGATGTIGTRLCQQLRERGDHVVVLSRDLSRALAPLDGVEAHEWPDPTATPAPQRALARADAVIHLLGEPVAQRWSESVKQRIRDSRVLATRNLVQSLNALPEGKRPEVLVSQSATGFYGPRNDEPLDEGAPGGDDFLSDVVEDWEREAGAAAPAMRVVTTRTGVVISPAGGALAQMLPFFKAGVGGPVAGGGQFVPWIHLDDVVAALLLCVDDSGIEGPVNVVTNQPVTNRELSRALGRVLHRPAVLPVPGLALRLLYGEMATIITTGQRPVPRRLLDHGFVFRHPEVDEALADVIGSQ